MLHILDHVSFLLSFQLSLLRVLVRNNGSTSRRKDTTSEATLGKNQVDVFQLEPLCLGVEEVYDWNPKEVQNGEDDKNAPIDVF